MLWKNIPYEAAQSNPLSNFDRVQLYYIKNLPYGRFYGWNWSISLRIVITSYSIHYTKLYEGWITCSRCWRRWMRGCWGRGSRVTGTRWPLRRVRPRVSRSVWARWTTRITSYNVCYTKLLRFCSSRLWCHFWPMSGWYVISIRLSITPASLRWRLKSDGSYCIGLTSNLFNWKRRVFRQSCG